MNKYRIPELVLCLGVIIAGLLYKTSLIPLSAILPIMALLFSVIPVLRYLGGKKQGLTGMGLYLPVLCMALIPLIVVAAWIVYLVQY